MIRKFFTATCLSAMLLTLASPAFTADKGQIELVYGEWSTEVASTNLLRVALEQAGYEVKMTTASIPIMWQALSVGDVDATVSAWLPTTHEHYLARVKDQVEDLGPNLPGIKIGLVVPDYVEIDSLNELGAMADRYDNKIVGIEPGTGIMNLTAQAAKEYDFDDVTLIEGTGPIMTAVLGDAIKNHEWIVVTGWTPHWMWVKWDLKYLQDPKAVYGSGEAIHTVVRKGLRKDMPEAYTVLDNFSWNAEQMGELMSWNQKKHSDPYENAKRWAREHADLVQSWMP